VANRAATYAVREVMIRIYRDKTMLNEQLLTELHKLDKAMIDASGASALRLFLPIRFIANGHQIDIIGLLA